MFFDLDVRTDKEPQTAMIVVDEEVRTKLAEEIRNAWGEEDKFYTALELAAPDGDGRYRVYVPEHALREFGEVIEGTWPEATTKLTRILEAKEAGAPTS